MRYWRRNRASELHTCLNLHGIDSPPQSFAELSFSYREGSRGFKVETEYVSSTHRGGGDTVGHVLERSIAEIDKGKELALEGRY